MTPFSSYTTSTSDASSTSSTPPSSSKPKPVGILTLFHLTSPFLLLFLGLSSSAGSVLASAAVMRWRLRACEAFLVGAVAAAPWRLRLRWTLPSAAPMLNVEAAELEGNAACFSARLLLLPPARALVIVGRLLATPILLAKSLYFALVAL